MANNLGKNSKNPKDQRPFQKGQAKGKKDGNLVEADKEWLFSAFHRGSNVGDKAGTGLGLVIVKRCVDLHGGSVKVNTTFVMFTQSSY